MTRGNEPLTSINQPAEKAYQVHDCFAVEMVLWLTFVLLIRQYSN